MLISSLIRPARGIALNDVHSRLNRSHPARHATPRNLAELVEIWRRAGRRGQSAAVCGGRHAMGGQQFLDNGLLIDMRLLNRILQFERETGTLTVEAGATWPGLMRGYLALQAGTAQAWGVRQKQTGADNLSIGGAIAANIHGRGLDCAPFSCDLISMQVLTPRGELVHCSRVCEPELFSLVTGGYGMFGIVTHATLQLVPRRKVERVVAVASLPELMPAFDARIAQGHVYGDFQFATAPEMPGFMRDGVLSCYRPVADDTPIAADQIRLSRENWQRLLYLAHANKRRAFMEFTDFYVRSSGQIYWSDTHQLNIYLDDYHRALDPCLGRGCEGTEMISELYVPRERLTGFMQAVREDFLEHEVDFIYGTVRLIRRDQDAFLRWAKQDYACVIFNLHVDHTPQGQSRAAADFRRLIDRAIEFDGSYFLTYHRHASREQLLACYPEFPAFVDRKLALDPHLRLLSDWFVHSTGLIGRPLV